MHDGTTECGAVVLVERIDKLTKKGVPMCTLTFRNATGLASMPVCSEGLSKIADLKEGMPLEITAERIVGRGIVHGHRQPGVIDEGLLAGDVHLAERGLQRVGPRAIVLTELRVLIAVRRPLLGPKSRATGG